MHTYDWIIPDWPVSSRVKAVSTTRAGGVSTNNYSSMNLALHVGDKSENVRQNRKILQSAMGYVPEPFWLRQSHSSKICKVAAITRDKTEADASISFKAEEVCAVMTADCLPVLLTNKNADTVAAVHAGWRGLAKGILEHTVNAFSKNPADIYAWLGPAIGPYSFEVGSEVYEAFVTDYAKTDKAFVAQKNDKFLADIYLLASLRLERAGVRNIYGSGFDTRQDERFFSYRQNPQTGRMASLIWLQDE